MKRGMCTVLSTTWQIMIGYRTRKTYLQPSIVRWNTWTSNKNIPLFLFWAKTTNRPVVLRGQCMYDLNGICGGLILLLDDKLGAIQPENSDWNLKVSFRLFVPSKLRPENRDFLRPVWSPRKILEKILRGKYWLPIIFSPIDLPWLFSANK